jgi:SET domain-containing protein 6
MDPMDIDDFQTTSDALISWLNRNGATISPKIQLEDLRKRAAGRGVGKSFVFTIPTTR